MSNSSCSRLVASEIELRVPAQYSLAPSTKVLVSNSLGPSPFAAVYFRQPFFDVDFVHLCFDLVSCALNPVSPWFQAVVVLWFWCGWRCRRCCHSLVRHVCCCLLVGVVFRFVVVVAEVLVVAAFAAVAVVVLLLFSFVARTPKPFLTLHVACSESCILDLLLMSKWHCRTAWSGLQRLRTI